MKKIFLFAAAVVAAMTINAQDKVVKVITEYANYIEFQALMANPDIANATITSEAPLTLPNGSVLTGFKNSEGKEGDCKWNAKPDYNTTYFVADGLEGVDSLTVGTQWRAASGCTLKFGAFTTTAAGKVSVFYQLNGDDSSKTGENVRGCSLQIYDNDPVEYRFATGKNLCVASFDLPAGSYDAGDVILKVVKNTINVCGIRIENLKEGQQAIDNIEAGEKAVKFFENGQLIILKNGVRYNALGAKL